MDLPDWQLDPTTYRATCERCGGTWSVLPTDPLPIRHHCASNERSLGVRQRGIGDLLGALIKAIGVTPSRFGRLLAFLRRIEGPVNCGCERRREQLNRLGRAIGKRWRDDSQHRGR
jgi:hypothetical protein